MAPRIGRRVGMVVVGSVKRGQGAVNLCKDRPSAMYGGMSPINIGVMKYPWTRP